MQNDPSLCFWVCPFELMRGRKVVSTLTPFWKVEALNEDCTVLKEASKAKFLSDKASLRSYEKSKLPTTKRVIKFSIGVWVHVKEPLLLQKGKPKFRDPARIVIIRGQAMKLDNGQWWNISRLAKVKNTDNLSNVLKKSYDPLIVRRSSRTKRVPCKFND